MTAHGVSSHRAVCLELPYLCARLPQLRFVHVVRDGRDMAFAQHMMHVQRWSDLELESKWRTASLQVRAAALWQQQNLAAADYGEQHMGARYILVRLEDLCDDPVKETRRLAAFLDRPNPSPELVAHYVKKSKSMGRWQGQDPALLQEIESAAALALKRFGYDSLSGLGQPPQ